MFEKSLYDLIRGLRNHKGNEKEYIQNSLKECRAEIRGQDMDVKATALLKLVYLEMFGHDMSWASFHVLEVMSSAKYIQKRVGYLGAVQSFRPDTEVLMLATNLLKKDLVSASLNTMSLPIITLPHIITPSLAMSVLSDLLPRMTHSNPAIRKKTIVTLYRLALVYPETLRPAWPKIKDRLMDENEDSSVTAAIVNVVCELGWRRPQDFLPLAPRLFELLVDSGNNWMAIKLIKLFATLTPLEPRLVRKLLPPLTSIIRTTPAMSLLYECINGIIQGGILGGTDDSFGGDEIATLCVSKLRGMIMVEGDPNLKYVALLAFNRIVVTHPNLVAEQEDVIMDCIDSADISIRLRALDLVVGMVSSSNLMSIVGRLMRQLRTSANISAADENNHSELPSSGVEPKAESDDESPEVNIKSHEKGADNTPSLPDDYKIDVISRILEMCSSNNYGNLLDFDWYIDVLIQLVRNAPVPRIASQVRDVTAFSDGEVVDISRSIGNELRVVAVKVKAIRPIATRAAESIIMGNYSGQISQIGPGMGALHSSAWIVGEFAVYLASPEDVLNALLQNARTFADPEALAVHLQAIPKLFALLSADDQIEWTSERKTMMSLLMARIIHTLEPLAIHPDLEVQERAVELSELLRLAAEASACQDPSSNTDQQVAPLLITQAMPSLFAGLELNSVAFGAQRNVPLPQGLDLDHPINSHLAELLREVGNSIHEDADRDGFEVYYHQQLSGLSAGMDEPAINKLAAKDGDMAPSYQNGSEETYLDPDIIARRRAERLERHKDDPFYIAGSHSASGISTTVDNVLKIENGDDLNIDSIPIMKLELGDTVSHGSESMPRNLPPKPRQRVKISADETLIASGASTPKSEDLQSNLPRLSGNKKSLLLVDSSSIGSFALEENITNDTGTFTNRDNQQREEAEMAKAMREVEALRLEMQRASERIQAAQGIPPDGTVVKKKAKKKSRMAMGSNEDLAMPRMKKASRTKTTAEGEESLETPSMLPKKKAKRKKVKIGESTGDRTIPDNGEATAAEPV